MAKSVTIRDVAKQAGVSIATVSDIISGRSDRFRDSTTEKVKKVAKDLCYRPHFGASSIRSKRLNIIGLLLSQNLSLEAKLTASLDKAAAEKDLSLLLMHVSKGDLDIPKMISRYQVDGLIADWDMPLNISEAIKDFDIPIIWVNNSFKAKTNCIWPEDTLGGQMAAEHLICLGHKKIAFLKGTHTVHPSQEMRIEGYRRAMIDEGLDEIIIDCTCNNVDLKHRSSPLYYEKRYKHSEIWSDIEEHEPTAFVCYNNMITMELYAACQRKGLNIGEKFSIVSCDYNDFLEMLVPSVSSILVPHDEIAKNAVAMLLEIIKNNGKPVESRILPVSLLELESSFAPNQSYLQRWRIGE